MYSFKKLKRIILIKNNSNFHTIFFSHCPTTCQRPADGPVQPATPATNCRRIHPLPLRLRIRATAPKFTASRRPSFWARLTGGIGICPGDTQKRDHRKQRRGEWGSCGTTGHFGQCRSGTGGAAAGKNGKKLFFQFFILNIILIFLNFVFFLLFLLMFHFAFFQILVKFF